ncbi:MAG: thiolase family protein [Deltaproteobacteria bacterium]|nr:thiolase family protein [Deltaproteobacteria bacterium]
MTDAVIVCAVRSPMGRANKGQFVHTRIDDLGAAVIRAALKRLPQLNKDEIEDVLIGCAMPEGEQGLNLARNISFLAGIPFSTGAATVNRFCGSSLETINMAAQAVWAGNGEVFVTGGAESMSHVPMGGFNPSLNPLLMKKEAPAAYIGMGQTAETLAKKWKVSREEQDRFSLGSHQKAIAAKRAGKLTEIVPVHAAQPDGTIKTADTDEGPREETSLEKLAQLKPAFLENGTVTAGNSSPLTDGAAAVIIMSAAKAKTLGTKPIAKIRAMAVGGVDPATMGEGPIVAVPKALKRAGMKLSDVDLIEINEAFAAQTLSVMKALEMDQAKLNVHGGAIALGHPLGCSGARIMATLLTALRDRNKTIGLETLCIGGGQGIATVVELLN